MLATAYGFARLLPLAWLGGALMPRVIALSLALALSCALSPMRALPDASVARVALGLLRELCLGGVIALSLTIALASVGWAVRLARAAPALERLYVLCALWLVLSLGGLRALVQALALSFRSAPIGGTLDHQAFALGVAQLAASALATAFLLALPFVCAALLVELMAALTARVLGWSPGTATPLTPLLMLGVGALLLVPLTLRAPELVRSALEAAAALTRTLAR